MTPLIFGAGGVGLALASFLIDSGVRPALIGRSKSRKSLHNSGLHRMGIFGTASVSADKFDVVERLDQIKTAPDVICICVKCFSNPDIVIELSAWNVMREHEIPIVLFQNGWGGHLPFVQSFGEGRVFSARLLTGFSLVAPNTVTVTVHGADACIGSMYGVQNHAVKNLAASLTRGGYTTCLVTDIVKDVWAKLLYNCSLNGLGAVLNVAYGKLTESKETRALIASVVKEVFQVMTAMDLSTHWPDADMFLNAFYKDMLPPTAGHISSTLQDIQRGARTEIDFLNGAIVRAGETHHVPTPTNAALCHLVHFIEDNSAGRAQ